MDNKPTFKDVFNPHTTPRDHGEHAAEVAQWRRLAVFIGGSAIIAGSLFAGNELTKERVVGEHSVTVENGNQPGPEVCGAVAELAKKHDRELNTEQCLEDLKDVTLPDGTTVGLVATNRIIGVAGDSIAFNAMGVKTSIDEKIEQARKEQ